MRNCWFGNSSKTAATLVAGIDIAYSLIHLSLGLAIVFLPEYFLESIHLDSPQNSFLVPAYEASAVKDGLMLPLIATISVFLAEFLLGILLLSSVVTRDPDKADLWVKIRLILLILGSFGYVFVLTLQPAYLNNGWMIFSSLAILLLAVIYRIYTIVIVRSFRSDLLFVLNGYDLGLLTEYAPIRKTYG